MVNGVIHNRGSESAEHYVWRLSVGMSLDSGFAFQKSGVILI